jgi:uncharacterized membrane protein
MSDEGPLAPGLGIGRVVFLILAVVLVGVLFATLDRLPPVVASHFDARGAPNGWSSRAAYAGLILMIGVVVPLAVVWLVHAVTKQGPQLLNIPARDYWRRPEHGAEAVRRARAYMWWLSSIMAATALAVHGLVVHANATTPPRLSTPAILTLLAGVLSAIGLWSVGWWLLLRPPTSARRTP